VVQKCTPAASKKVQCIAMPDLCASGVYPEREEERIGKLDKVGLALSGMIAPIIRPRPSHFQWIVDIANKEEDAMRRLMDKEILPLARELGGQMRRRGFMEDLVGLSFALVREVAYRRIGLRHFDVQLIGGIVLLKGMIAEMETGEGKTLTATLAASTAALAGIPVHIITVNDYLALRDTEEMGPIYKALGLTVGTIKQGMSPDDRRVAYSCNITYCTNKEVTFDYLKDRIVLWNRPGQVRLQLERLYGESSRMDKVIMRGLHFAIVDEADSVLIDEARTPLIISGESSTEKTEHAIYREAFDVASLLATPTHYEIQLSDRNIEVTDSGRYVIEEQPWTNAKVWTTSRQREEIVRQALVAINLFDRDKHYLVTEGKVQIVDEYTGRVMPDRSWEQGLHQLIEIKEQCEMTSRKETKARISYQRFFRRYLRLSGMTGTAREVTSELWTTYRLKVVSIPTNRPLQRTYLPEHVYTTENEKWDALVERADFLSRSGRPILVGTRSVAASEELSRRLELRGLDHRVLNARQDKQEADIVAQAGQPGCITVATNMAGRGTDIKLEASVARLGGLHVVATERHDAGRIDRQLFGRCARQGDPGSCEAYLSIQDELIKMHGNGFLAKTVAGLLKTPGSPLTVWTGRLLFRMAQHAAQRLHYKMRRNLLKMDEQLSDALAFSGRTE
jgi:preprotein translocase subunit SecA